MNIEIDSIIMELNAYLTYNTSIFHGNCIGVYRFKCLTVPLITTHNNEYKTFNGNAVVLFSHFDSLIIHKSFVITFLRI